MARTLSFNKWVAEYKPVEFDEDFLFFPEYQVISKYLKRENPFRAGYPSSHCAAVYCHDYTKRSNGKIVRSSGIYFLGFIVTRKPGNKYDDAVKFKSDFVLFLIHYDY